MTELNYQQILADVYEQNANEILVYPNDNYNQIGPEDKNPDELDNQGEFEREHISHQLAYMLPPVNPYGGANQSRTTKTLVINIDSRFRNNRTDPIGNCYFKFLTPVRNAASIRISTLEFPNSFYAFSKQRGNVSFTLYYPSGSTTPLPIEISDGNWTQNPSVPEYPDPSSMYYAVATALNNAVTTALGLTTPSTIFRMTLNNVTGRVTLSTSDKSNFDLDFTPPTANLKLGNYGLGYNLGFRQFTYTGVNSLTAESLLDTSDVNYCFLCLNDDWKLTLHQTFGTELRCYSKLILDSPKFAFTYGNGGNTLSSNYTFAQPTDVPGLKIRVLDIFGQDIDMLMDFSMTVEITTIIHAGNYDAARN
jgi:hypothetical protein